MLRQVKKHKESFWYDKIFEEERFDIKTTTWRPMPRLARRLSYVKDDVDLTILRFIDEGHMNKTCGKGEYYCYQSKNVKIFQKE